MPTTKPRLNVALDMRSFLAVKSLADAAGVSMSSIIAEHVQAVAPVLERTAQLLQLGKRAQVERLGVVRELVDRAEVAMGPLVSGAAAVLDRSWSDLERELSRPHEVTGAGEVAPGPAVSERFPGESEPKPAQPPEGLRSRPQGAARDAGETGGRGRPGEGAKRPPGASQAFGDPRASNYGGQVGPKGSRAKRTRGGARS